MIILDIAFILFLIVVAYILVRIIEIIFSKAFTFKEFNKNVNLLKRAEKPLALILMLTAIYIGVSTAPEFSSYSQSIVQVFEILMVVSGGYFFIKIGNLFIEHQSKISSRTLIKDFAPTLSKIWDLFVLVVTATIIMGFFGIQITAIIAGLGIAGIAIGLALQDSLSNFFSGISMGSDKMVGIGDYIKLDSGVEGFIERFTWRNVKIKTLSSTFVFISNNRLSQSIVTNYEQKPVVFSIAVSVSYESDLDRVEKVTKEVAEEIVKKTPGAFVDFTPSVMFSSFGDSGVNFSVFFKSQTYAGQYLLKHEFIKAVYKRYKKEGIEIPFPTTQVYLKKQ